MGEKPTVAEAALIEEARRVPQPDTRALSQASQMVQLVTETGVVLFHDADGEPFVRVVADDMRETWRMRTKPFKAHMARLSARQDRGHARRRGRERGPPGTRRHRAL